MTVPSLLIIATLLPLASFLLLVFLGRRLGNPLAGWVATAAIGASFACSLAALMFWLSGGTVAAAEVAKDRQVLGEAILRTFGWIPTGSGLAQSSGGFLELGIYVDSLTVLMFLMVTLISTLVHVFSIGYMSEDKRFPLFFAYLGLFCFSMLGLVIGGTILQLFVFWELVGLCSYLLIGFWYEKKSASNAAIKAFVTNRVGDFGFLIGLGILFYHLGNVTLPQVWVLLDMSKFDAAKGLAVGGHLIGPTVLTIMGIGLFFGAVGKSAQFPLHVWLPDAMEGPTPVSALIHAATMVAAGVYLVGRIFPILTPDAKLFIAIIGLTTLTMAALIALAQSDIKKVLAYSTISQLGYMILAMGIGSWIGGLFHLITHAFFKALLFLGSGSVIYAAHHEQELSQYGGLLRKIPVTAACFGIAVLAIAGTPFFSGYYSKDMILAHAGAFASLAEHLGHGGAYWLLFVIPVCVAYLTAFYMMRCWMLTFWGMPRNDHVYNHAQERPVMYWPLIVLAVFSIIGGRFIGVKDMLRSSVEEGKIFCQNMAEKMEHGGKFGGFDQAWSADAPEPKEAATVSQKAQEHGEHLVHWVAPAFVVGIGLAFLIYMRGYTVAGWLVKIKPVGWIHTWLYRKMYFDELYGAIFVGVTMGLAKLSGIFDKYFVDGLVNLAGWLVRQFSFASGRYDNVVIDGAVNGVGELAQDVGVVARVPQTGRIRLYVTVLLGAAALAAAAAVVSMAF